MNVEPLPVPSLEGGWDAFAADMARNGIKQAELDGIKLIWYSGAVAMAVIMTSRTASLSEKIGAMDDALNYITTHSQFHRLRAKVKGG